MFIVMLAVHNRGNVGPDLPWHIVSHPLFHPTSTLAATCFSHHQHQHANTHRDVLLPACWGAAIVDVGHTNRTQSCTLQKDIY
jgi:hypothetical protein